MKGRIKILLNKSYLVRQWGPAMCFLITCCQIHIVLLWALVQSTYTEQSRAFEVLWGNYPPSFVTYEDRLSLHLDDICLVNIKQTLFCVQLFSPFSVFVKSVCFVSPLSWTVHLSLSSFPVLLLLMKQEFSFFFFFFIWVKLWWFGLNRASFLVLEDVTPPGWQVPFISMSLWRDLNINDNFGEGKFIHIVGLCFLKQMSQLGGQVELKRILCHLKYYIKPDRKYCGTLLCQSCSFLIFMIQTRWEMPLTC